MTVKVHEDCHVVQFLFVEKIVWEFIGRSQNVVSSPDACIGFTLVGFLKHIKAKTRIRFRYFHLKWQKHEIFLLFINLC